MGFFFSKKYKQKINKNDKLEKKNIKSVYVKIPAKLMISGEHSVIYNSKAVICAINIFSKIEIKKISSHQIIIKDGKENYKVNLQDFSLEYENNDLILEIIRRFFDTTKLPLCGIKIVIKNSIPIGCGLGSSSALVAGIVFGLNKMFGSEKKNANLLQIATEIENIFHCKSSGADIQTIVKGGIVYFNDGKIKKIAHQIDEIYIINTGRPSFSTKNVVMNIYDRFTSSHDIWENIGNITKSISEMMPSNKKITKKIAENEILLEKLGIVTPSVSDFIADLKENKIYGKVCGAGTIAERENEGGSGIVGIFQKLSKDQKKYLSALCEKNNFSLKKVYIYNAGITIFSK